MQVYVLEDVENVELLDDEALIQFAIDLSDESIANLRRDIDESKK